MAVRLALFLSVVAVLCAAAAPSRAQTAGDILQCEGNDTTSYYSAFPLATLHSCTVTTGPRGIILAVAEGSAVCDATETVQMFVGPGTSPITGSNFGGTFGSVAVTGGTYTQGTGDVSLTLASSLNLSVGDPIDISGTTGAGSDLSMVDGLHTTTAGTSGTTVHFTIVTNRTISSITGGAAGPGAGLLRVFSLAPAATGSFGDSILSGTYNSSPSGIVSLTLSGSDLNLAPGSIFNVSGVQGTGSVSLLLGQHTATAGTGGTTLNFQVGPGQTLSISPGGGISQPPWDIHVGQFLTGLGTAGIGPTTITGSGVTNPGTYDGYGSIGRYAISDATISGGGHNLFTLDDIPGGVTTIQTPFPQNGCNIGSVFTTVAGKYYGIPFTKYWVGFAVLSSDSSSQAGWLNNSISILTE